MAVGVTVWLGGLLMALGGCIAVLDARYRRLKQKLLQVQVAEAAR